MKKFINVLAVMLALVMCLGIVVACAEDEPSNDDKTTTAASTTKKPESTTTATQTTTTTEGTTTTSEPERVADPTVEVPADGVITTAEQLHAVLVNGDVTKNYTVNAQTLDMSKYTWKGMVGYTGTFDFGGCTVSGAADSLFISVLGGTVKNLVLANATYTYTDEMSKADTDAKDPAKTPNLHYSPVIRYSKDATIEGIVVESTVKITADIFAEGSYHGGVVGNAEGAAVVIKNCHFKGEYSTDSMLVRFGGIAGCIITSDKTTVNLDAPEQSAAIITNCTNSGLLINKGFTKDSKFGGVVGHLGNAAVIKCANYGEVRSNDAGQTAGVVGYVGGDTVVKDCLNTGKVSGASFVGGITGYSNAGDSSKRIFTNCINLGNVSSSTDDWGGILGLTKSTEALTNCFNLYTDAGTKKFSRENTVGGECKPDDPATHGKLVVVNCANFDTVDAIVAAMEAANPGVFVKDGDSIKLAG